MTIYLPILLLVSLALAEPPVGDGYPASRSSHDHTNNGGHGEHFDHQSPEHQFPMEDYTVPSTGSARNALSTEYGAPNARTASNTQGQSHKFTPPTARVSFNQRFRSSTSTNSAQGYTASAPRSQSQEYATSNAQSEISQEYGVPSARHTDQEYAVPSIMSARTLSTEYGMPDARSIPSQEYGVPVVAARSQAPHSLGSNFLSSQTRKDQSQDYSLPSAKSQFQKESQTHAFSAPFARSNENTKDNSAHGQRSQFQANALSHSHTVLLSRSNDAAQSYNAPANSDVSGFASRSPSKSYGAPKRTQSTNYDSSASRSPSQSYGLPSSRRSDSHSQDKNSVSETYGAPHQGDVSATYGAPNVRSPSEEYGVPSQEYGVPSSRANLQSSSGSSSHSPASSRSAPSSTYLPSARDAMPSNQYGVPEQANDKGYDYAKSKAQDELLSQEPASYDFAYQIEDQESGSDFGHSETRENNRAEGSYFVVLPDGTKQTVEYEADEGGFRPRISMEPAASSARSGSGYDENASDVFGRSADGPY